MTDDVTLSIIVPAYNEEEVLEAFHSRMSKVLTETELTYEIIFINDGSTDSTLAKLKDLANNDPHVVAIDLSRNFGKEIAMTAGFDNARGKAVIPIDADLQDPPELIHDMIDVWRQGADVVYAQRTHRDGESWLKIKTANVFYKLMQNLGERTSLPPNVGDYRLMDRRAVDALNHYREHHRFMKGLFANIGFDQRAVQYRRDPRFAGETKFNFWKLWNFSLEGITSFTTAPLRAATYIGLAIATIAVLYAVYIIFKTIFVGDPVAGFPTLFVTVSLLGGIQLMFLGVIGEYLGRIFNETKARPLYFVKKIY